MTSTSDGVKSKLLNLKAVYEGGLLFKIPSYQRPYVWSDDDVLKLFDDIKNACLRDEPHYFIGTTLSSCVGDEAILELVDGQQRTTTLMLICLAFKHAGIASDLSELAVYKGNGDYHNTPRLQFDIRESVQQLFGAKAGLDANYQEPSPEEIKSNPYLTQINKALIVLVERVASLEKASTSTDTSKEFVSAKRLSDYIYTQVHWVNNIVPKGTDLNRLFATMNTAGVQLEQSDILKAKLFKHIAAATKPRYEAIWAACEQMDNYFERNVRQVFPETDWSGIKPDDLARFSDRFVLDAPNVDGDGVSGGQTIAQLLEASVTPGSSGNGEIEESKGGAGEESNSSETDEMKDLSVNCRSIVSFPLLLIHAYRIYLLEQHRGDIEKPVHGKHLLEIFKPLSDGPKAGDENSMECEVKGFIDTLWRTRYAFDRWVVKWVEREDDPEQQLGLAAPSASDSGKSRYINRSKPPLDAMLMLQSVRYYTSDRSAQYWLTPYLALLLKGDAIDSDSVLKLLERIDNQMSLAAVTRKESSFALACAQDFATITWAEQKGYFEESLGTGFEHYWFQKLEYVLWLEYKTGSTKLGGEEKRILEGEEKRKFDEFRITSKNSVEHVHPQNEENRKTLHNEGSQSSVSELAKQEHYDSLNAFGNLVLLSPGENSSYSNQTVLKKKADFIGKRQLSSLKLHKIFTTVKEGDEWNVSMIKAHQQQMIEVLSKHYQISR